MRGLRRAKIKLSLSGAVSLSNILEGQVTSGTRENQTLWLLLLEVLQFTDQQERFEELALEYAMTFEESPPSWEPIAEAVASGIAAATARQTMNVTDVAYCNPTAAELADKM